MSGKVDCVYWNNAQGHKKCEKISNFLPAGCKCDQYHTGTSTRVPSCHALEPKEMFEDVTQDQGLLS